jgi:hypothetical protein
VLKASRGPDPGEPFSYSGIRRVIEKRLELANLRFKTVTKDSGDLLDITIFDVTDTTFIIPWVIEEGRVQFREMYSPQELSNLLQAAVFYLDSVEAGKKPKQKKQVVDSTVSDPVKKLLNDMQEDRSLRQDDSEDQLFYFSEYSEAEIGHVKMTDTGRARSLLERNDISKHGPMDKELAFGIPVKYKKPVSVPVYFLKTYGIPGKAVIENEDVNRAWAEITNDGKAEIYIEFNAHGSSKFAVLTRKNTDRCIAIVLNDEVIMTPKVLSEINGGNITINGSYTISEARALAVKIMEPNVPGTLSLVSSKVERADGWLANLKRWLLALGSFLLVGGLAYFVLKTLKHT